MKFKIQIEPRLLHFKQPAGTSRGIYTRRQVWYVHLSSPTDPQRVGVGECAPLLDLSVDAVPEYEDVLREACRRVELTGEVDREALRNFPSIVFGLETALCHFEVGSYQLWNTPFSRGEEGITINGLVWMGDYRTMCSRLEEKLKSGFRCVKLKIGAIDFEDELQLLRLIREHFSPEKVELRVDANGAFGVKDALEKLKRLSDFQLHSIEQPIRQGQWQEMARLCEESPLPIALDEELIGVNLPEIKEELLKTIRPQYIILKPTLHGGLRGSKEWISMAEEQHIGWWITSALESNVGLNAIAQWCASFSPVMPQGLGTGQLFTDNVPMPLEIRGDKLWFNPQSK